MFEESSREEEKMGEKSLRFDLQPYIICYQMKRGDQGDSLGGFGGEEGFLGRS